MSLYFGEPVITEEAVNAIADQIWSQAATFTDEDWFVFVAQYEANLAPAVECGFTDRLEIGYAVLRPIPYQIEKIGDGNYEAIFTEANIAIGGVDEQDAYQSLVAEILDTFDALSEEQELGPDAAAQLAVLRQYIAKT